MRSVRSRPAGANWRRRYVDAPAMPTAASASNAMLRARVDGC